ncbi:hypothetical protein AAFF_G00038250 [Aldrovandia affinis]|uniref:Uncharacterized protein n=1 Tax=Aldrovandia affinis TaxID=143900 RepID=A0AAD7T5I3_9TELE|nr:hypothetical protein AAFF_G00038250 [Aldrovandia affinis]
MQTVGLIHTLEQCLNRMQTVGPIHTLEQCFNRMQTVGLIHTLEQCLHRMQTVGPIHTLEQCLNRTQTVGLIHTLEQCLNRMQTGVGRNSMSLPSCRDKLLRRNRMTLIWDQGIGQGGRGRGSGHAAAPELIRAADAVITTHLPQELLLAPGNRQG